MPGTTPNVTSTNARMDGSHSKLRYGAEGGDAKDLFEEGDEVLIYSRHDSKMSEEPCSGPL